MLFITLNAQTAVAISILADKRLSMRKKWRFNENLFFNKPCLRQDFLITFNLAVLYSLPKM